MTIPKDWKNITKDNYNTYATEFAKWANVFRGKKQEVIDKFISLLPFKASILDAGCGAGQDSAYFVNKGFQVMGIDFSEKLLAIAKQRASKGTFKLMDLEDITLPKENFDAIWAHASLQHLPKDRILSVLKKLKGLLKKNGLFFMTLRMGDGERLVEQKRGGAMLRRFYAHYQLKEVLELLKKSNFKLLSYELDLQPDNWGAFYAKNIL